MARTNIDIDDVQNSDIDINVTNNQYNNNYYGSYYRPRAFSTVYSGSFWQYQKPRCYRTGGHAYYYYPRPNKCKRFKFCDRRGHGYGSYGNSYGNSYGSYDNYGWDD